MGESCEYSSKSVALPDMRGHKKNAFTTHTVNNGISQNFNQKYMNIILATISTLLYKELLLYIFNIVHVNSMY